MTRLTIMGSLFQAILVLLLEWGHTFFELSVLPPWGGGGGCNTMHILRTTGQTETLQESNMLSKNTAQCLNLNMG